MKRTAVALALATLSAGTLVSAHSDTAEVLSAVPYYERVAVPREQCYDESVPVRSRPVYREEVRVRSQEPAGIGPGTVLGAIIGGVIGHQFGNSTAGRDHGTAAGAVIGGIVGNQVDRDSRTERVVSAEPPVREVQYRTVSRCETAREYREEVRGYDVTYRYNGRDYRTRLPYDPGRTLQVNVNVAPERGARNAAPVAPRYESAPARPGSDERWN